MTRLRLTSFNLDTKELFGEESLELEPDHLSLGDLLQTLDEKSGRKIGFIQDGRANEEYTILLNERNLRIQTTSLDTRVQVSDGDELCVVRMNILIGG